MVRVGVGTLTPPQGLPRHFSCKSRRERPEGREHEPQRAAGKRALEGPRLAPGNLPPQREGRPSPAPTPRQRGLGEDAAAPRASGASQVSPDEGAED